MNHLPMAPRKVRSVANVLKGMDVSRARLQLKSITRRPVSPLSKLLDSAIANAVNNFSMVEDNLFVKEVLVNEGIKLVRYMPKARGAAGLIQKKRSHVTILLDERVAGLRGQKKQVKAKEDVHEGEVGDPHGGQVKETPRSEYSKPGRGIMKGVRNMGKKIFQPRVNRLTRSSGE